MDSLTTGLDDNLEGVVATMVSQGGCLWLR
jgi:hypothetical protein